MTYLEKEIHEQPDVARRLISKQAAHIHQIAAAIRDKQPSYVVIAARGTSDNAARYAKYLFGHYLNFPVMLATPSLHTIYDSPPKFHNALVIGISQSGKAEDVRQVLADANDDNAVTLAITNDESSPLAQTAQHHIALLAGEEISIAATKTYTAQLITIAMLTAALAHDVEQMQVLDQIPVWLQETLTFSQTIPIWVERYRYMSRYAVIGRGFNYCTAFEVNLKIKELCSISGEGYSEADFLHGPIALIKPDFPVIVIAPDGKPTERMQHLVEQLENRGGETIIFSNVASLLERATKSVQLPVIPEWVSPIVSVVPGQIFGLHLAQTLGHTVDTPHGLSKVTITE